MAGILDNYREQIAEWCARSLRDADIHRMLKNLGCLIGRERVRTWLADETAAGRLPARRFVSRRGRPPGRRKVSQPGTAAETSSDSSAAACAPSHPVLLDAETFARIFNIPLAADGWLDLRQLARDLGSKRIESMSDMEMFLLESFETPWRDDPQRWTGTWVDSVLKSSHELRQEMLAAAEIHELTWTCKSGPASPGA